jgi:hypothetical protein
MTPFTLTKQQSSSNSTHTFDPSLLFGVSTLDHSAAMMNANKEYKAKQPDSCFPIGPFHIFVPSTKMRQWDDGMMRQ